MGKSAGAVLDGLHGFAPSLTSLVGRTADTRDLAGLLARSRLVTVVGPGGVGKTRLAGEVAGRAADQFADGAWLVELATVGDPALVPAAMAAALGLRQAPGATITESLRASLARQQALLVLDNCEHVLAAVAELCGTLLPAADDLRILATSREPIGIAGETRFRLAPLPVTGPGEQADASVPAVALFAERARQADPRFVLDDEALALAGRLVARLDGMPLAIELAAARVEALGLRQLLERLEDRFLLLTSRDETAAPRHRSLSATMEWSYQLLDETEQRAFRRVAAFPAAFTLEAAAAVTGAGTEPALLRLVDCSLLAPPRVGPDGRSRYLMLETLRAFGQGQLAAAGEAEPTLAALTRHALASAEQAAAQRALSGGELAGGRWLDAEDATTQRALDWALRHDPATAVRLAVALTPWWILRGRGTEGYALLSAATAADGAHGGAAQYQLGLAAVSTGDVTAGLRHFTAACDRLAAAGPSPELALALGGRADLRTLVLGGRGDGEQDARRALAMARETGAPAGAALALIAISQGAYFADDFPAAVDLARQARRIDPAAIPGELAREVRLRLSVALIEAGDLAAARESSAEAVTLARTADDLSAETFGLLLLARVESRAGNLAGAWSQLGAALRLATRIGDRRRLRMCLPLGGELCAATGRWSEAVTVWSAYLEIMRDNDLVETARNVERRQQLLQSASRALGPQRSREARERGALMTLDIATELLLLLAESGLPDPPARGSSVGPRPAGELSARERELVTLVAKGHTDAQIAGELFISVSTVRSHLDRIRDKTSCRRRAELTRLALREGLI